MRATVRDTVRERILSRLTEMDRDMAWLARMLEVNQSTVSRWLAGGVPDHRYREIARVLHKPEAWVRGQMERVAA